MWPVHAAVVHACGRYGEQHHHCPACSWLTRGSAQPSSGEGMMHTTSCATRQQQQRWLLTAGGASRVGCWWAACLCQPAVHQARHGVQVRAHQIGVAQAADTLTRSCSPGPLLLMLMPLMINADEASPRHGSMLRMRLRRLCSAAATAAAGRHSAGAHSLAPPPPGALPPVLVAGCATPCAVAAVCHTSTGLQPHTRSRDLHV